MRDGATSERSCIAWALRRWRPSQAPAKPRQATRSTPTCCASWRSPAPTRSGRWTRLTSRWRGGFVYLTAVVDVASRKVLAHKVAITLEACHAREVIEQAFARYGTPEIVNTDQGSQFTAEEFTRVVLDQGCKLSMDGRGAWRDNVFVERLWRSVKYERVYLKAYDSVSAARTDIAEYLSWYNTHRSHSSLGRITPDEQYLAALPPMRLAA